MDRTIWKKLKEDVSKVITYFNSGIISSTGSFSTSGIVFTLGNISKLWEYLDRKPNIYENIFPHQDERGYWLEVSVTIPKNLHKKSSFNAFPPMPENKVICYKDLSPTQKKLLVRKLGKKAALRYRSKKLVSTLEDKKKYKIHYLVLKQAISLGVR